MHWEEYHEYWHRIAAECDLALEAVGKLNFSVMTLNRCGRGQDQYRLFQKEVFQAIGGLLTAAGNLSCLIWPDKARKSQGESGRVNIISHTDNTIAAKYLRQCLRIKKGHILRKRWLQDWFAKKMQALDPHQHQEKAFHFVGSCLPFYGHFMPTMTFLYDPLSRKIQCAGKTLDIQEIAAGISSVKRALQDKIRETILKRTSNSGRKVGLIVDASMSTTL